ncbi:muscarinic acetylcholine receptor M3-like [Physella acuta]|uniref:muscarinic acetylcholine receptor M3-like n=1 Tax=Physella acuta TaxID=109671 RepID=UPI0027DB595C|nr:muscarinic acetylcholine receptor M3-like [Physella acuta]
MRRPTSEELDCLVYNTTAGRLLCLNDVKARLYLPVTVFLGVLIIIGTIGNATVCLVYCKRKSRVSSHYFILYLAALDLVTCVIGMPTEIADLVLPYTFDSPWACKILRFTHSSTIIASSTILIEVAFDRYYRICQLGRQFTPNKSQLLCMGAVILGLVCSGPTFILFGKKTVIRNLNGNILKGNDCSTDDSMRRTIYPTIYYVFLFSLFGITVMFFAVLYSKIGLTILGRKRLHMGSVTSTTSSSKALLRTGSKKDAPSEQPSSDLSSEQDDANGASTASGNSNHSNHSNNSSASACSVASTSTSSTIISTPVFSSIRRHGKRLRPLEDGAQWVHPGITYKRNSAGLNIITSLPLPPAIMPDVVIETPNPSVTLDVINNNEENAHNCNKTEPGLPTNQITPVIEGSALTRTPSRKNGRTRFFYRNFHHQTHQHPVDTTDDEDSVAHGQGDHKHQQSLKDRINQRNTQRQLRVGKTTTVLFAVTLAYILSFLPYLTVMVLRSVIRDLEENLSPVGELAYKLCVKSFFINNAINPLIYSFLNQTFRQDAKLMLSKCCGRRNNFTSRPRVRAQHTPEAV